MSAIYGTNTVPHLIKFVAKRQCALIISELATIESVKRNNIESLFCFRQRDVVRRESIATTRNSTIL